MEDFYYDEDDYDEEIEEGEISMSENFQEETSGSINVNISMAEMEDRIIRVFQNTIDVKVREQVARIVEDEFKAKVKEQTQAILNQKISDCVELLFNQPVTIGGGWREDAITISRNEYLLREIGKQLEDGFSKKKYDEKITNEAQKQIEKFADNARREVNNSVKDIFDVAMQKNLTNSILNVLMQNETYQKLNGSVQNLIEAKSDK